MKYNPDDFGEPLFDPAAFTLPEPVAQQPDSNSSDPFVPLPAPYRGGAAQMFDAPQQPQLQDYNPSPLAQSSQSLPPLQPLYRPNERTFDPNDVQVATRPEQDWTNFGDNDAGYQNALDQYRQQIDRRGITELSETPSPGQILGRTASKAGRLAMGTVADVAAGMAGDPSQSGNIPAAWRGDELPIEQSIGSLDKSLGTVEGWQRQLGLLALGGADMAAKIGIGGGLGKLTGLGHLATDITFGSNEQGIDPMQTLIFAGIGPVADAGAKVTRDVLKTAMGEYQPILTPVLKAMTDGSDKFAGYVVNDTAKSIPFLSKPLVQKTIEQLGRFGATNLYLDAVAAAEAMGLPDEQRSQAIMDAFVQNIALSAMGLSDILKDHPAIEREISPEQKANIERVTNLVRDSWSMSDPTERRLAEQKADAIAGGGGIKFHNLPIIVPDDGAAQSAQPPSEVYLSPANQGRLRQAPARDTGVTPPRPAAEPNPYQHLSPVQQHPEDPAFYAAKGVAEPEQAAANAVVANDLVHNAVQSLHTEPSVAPAEVKPTGQVPAQARETLAARILKKMGVTDETASGFLQHWRAPETRDLETMRAQLIKDFYGAGLVPEGSISMYHEDPAHYAPYGTPEEAQDHAVNAREQNQILKAKVQERNRQALDRLAQPQSPDRSVQNPVSNPDIQVGDVPRVVSGEEQGVRGGPVAPRMPERRLRQGRAVGDQVSSPENPIRLKDAITEQDLKTAQTHKEIFDEQDARYRARLEEGNRYEDAMERPSVEAAFFAFERTKAGRKLIDTMPEDAEHDDPRALKIDAEVIRKAWKDGERDWPEVVRRLHTELFAELDRSTPAAPAQGGEPSAPKTRLQRAEEATTRNLAAAGDATVIRMAPPNDSYGKGFNVIISQVVSQPGKWQAAMFLGDNPLAQDHGFYNSREDAIRSYSGQSVGGQKPKGEPEFRVVEAMTPKKKAAKPASEPAKPAPVPANQVEPPAKPAPVDQPVKSPEPVVKPKKARLRQAKPVEATAGTARATEKPPEETAVLKPTEQKKFLGTEIDKALADAPDKQDRSTTQASRHLGAIEDQKEASIKPGTYAINYRQVADYARENGLLEHYGIKDKGDASKIVTNLEAAMEAQSHKQVPHVTIEVPGDGTFSVINDKDALRAFKDRLKRFPTKLPQDTPPRLPNADPSKLTAVAKGPIKVQDMIKVASQSASGDASRWIITHVVSNGKEIVATDGRRMLIIKANGGGTAKAPIFYMDGKARTPADMLKEIVESARQTYRDEHEGQELPKSMEPKDPPTYPNYRQVLPDPKEMTGIPLNTTDVGYAMSEVLAFFKGTDETVKKGGKHLVTQKPSVAVKLWANPDGTFGLSGKDENFGEFSHNVQPDGKNIGSFSPEYLQDGLNSARQLGHETVTLYHKDDLTAIIVHADNMDYILMPMRQNSLATEAPAELIGEHRDMAAQGRDDIRQLIHEANLPPHAEAVAHAILDEPALRDADLSDLRVELKRHIDGGYAGTLEGSLLTLSRTDMQADTFPHEIFHLLERMLPEADRDAVERWRVEEIKAKYGDTRPDLEAGMTSQEFKAAEDRGELERVDYRLSNSSEWLAGTFGKRFADEHFDHRNDSAARALWEKVKRFAKGLWDSVRRAVGADPTRDQLYRELLDGKFKQDPEADRHYDELQGSFAATAREASSHEALAVTPEQKETEGRSLQAQQADLARLTTQHGAGAISGSAQSLIQYHDALGIAATGHRLTGTPMGYEQLRQNVTPVERNNLAGAAGQAWEVARQRRAELDKDLAAEQQRQGGPAFLNKVARHNAAQIRAQQAAQAITISDTILTTALKKAVAALNYERLNALDRAMLEGQMKEIRQQAQARAGMQALITDMTTVLGTTARGQHLLQHGGTEAEIATEYRRIKTAAGQPMTNAALIRTGAYVVGKSKTLRDQMLANSLLAQAPVRAQMTAYEAQILAAYQKDPVKAIRQMLKDRGKLTTVKEQAAFAWQQLHADLLKDHKRLADLQDASDILGKAIDSPEAQRIQKLIRQDRGELGNKEPIRVGATAKITLPSGREVPVELERLTNSSAEFRKSRAVWMTAQAELENWISQHTEGDPDYGYHVSSLNRLLSTYTDLDVLQPGDQSTIRPVAMTRVTQAVDAIGGRMARATKGLVAEWERVGNKAAWWTQDWTGKIKDSRLKALQSHGLDTTGNHLNASLRAYEDVRNELAASWNREAGGLKVGDTIGTRGWKVTAQDLVQLRTEQQAAAAGFKIAPDQVTEDTRGDARTFRKALAGTDYTTPRRLNYDRVPFAKAFLDAAKGHWQDVGPVVDKDFPAFIRSFLEFRDPGDGATATIFDGAGAAFERVRQNPANNWNDFIQQVATVSGETPDNTAAIILKEMTAGIGKWRAVAEPGGVTVSGGDKTRNSFTQGRGDAITFPYFYEHGFKDTNAIVSFGTGIHSKPMDAVANGFKAIEADLQRQLREYAAATKAERQAGRMASANGINYDTWVDLDRRLSLAQGIIRGLTGENTEVAQMDKDIDRAMTGLVGKLIGTAATLRNVVSGPAQLGPQLFALNGSMARSFPLATIFTWMHSGALRMLPQAVGAGARLAYKLPGGLISAIGNIPVDRSAAKFYWRTVRPAIEDLGRLMYERQKSYKAMMDAGIHHIPDIVTEFDNRILGNLASGNRMDLGDVGPLRFVLQSALGASEATLDAATRGFSPLAGDTALNDATRTVMLSRFGEIHRIEERLKGLYLDWKKSGYRTFNLNNPNDEANLFTRQEMFPSLSLKEGRVFGTEGDMNRMRGAFKRAGFQFDAEAVKLFKALETDPKAQFLSDDQRNQFASSMIDAVNRATKANEPLALQGGGVLKSVFRPFFPWPTRMFGELYQLLSIPTSAGKGATSYRQMQIKRAAEWGLYGATVVVPALVGMALLKVGGEQIMRTYNQVAFNQTSFSRQPWEWGSTGQQLKGWALSAFDMVPLLNILTNKLFNDMPGRAQFDPSIVAVEKTKDLVKYIGGAIQTGDPSYRLPELIEGLVPDSKILINRLPGMEGKRELNNIANIYRRNADSEMLKPIGGIGGVNATDLTPYGSRMANAAIKGDTEELKRLYDEAVVKATEMGKANPEQAVNSMLKSANPELRALKTAMTPEQYQDFLGRLDATDRAYIEDGQQRFQDSLAALGLNTTYTKDAKEPSGSVAGVSGPKAAPSSGSVRGDNYGAAGPGLLSGAPAPRVGVGRVSGAVARTAAPRVLRSPSLRSRTSGRSRALGRTRTARLRGGLLR